MKQDARYLEPIRPVPDKVWDRMQESEPKLSKFALEAKLDHLSPRYHYLLHRRTITQLGVRSVVEVPTQVFATVADRYYDASRWPQRIGAGTSWVPGPFEVPRELLAPPVKRWPPVTIGPTAQTSRESTQQQQQRASAATRQPVADEVLRSLPPIAHKYSPSSINEGGPWRQVPPNSPSTPRRGKELGSGKSTVSPRPPLA